MRMQVSSWSGGRAWGVGRPTQDRRSDDSTRLTRLTRLWTRLTRLGSTDSLDGPRMSMNESSCGQCGYRYQRRCRAALFIFRICSRRYQLNLVSTERLLHDTSNRRIQRELSDDMQIWCFHCLLQKDSPSAIAFCSPHTTKF